VNLTEQIEAEYGAMKELQISTIKNNEKSYQIQEQFFQVYHALMDYNEKISSSFESFIKKERQMIQQANRLLDKIIYTSEDISLFSLRVSELFSESMHGDFVNQALIGIFLSEMINTCFKKTQIKNSGHLPQEINKCTLFLPEEKKIFLLCSNLSCGIVEIFGDVGNHCFHNMSGGTVIVHGNSGVYTGLSMSGGILYIDGSVEGWSGNKMTGGEICVSKNAGENIGDYMNSSCSKGNITIGGNAKGQIGKGMEDGEISIKGNVDYFNPQFIKGGKVTIEGKIKVMSNYETVGKIYIQDRSAIPNYISNKSLASNNIFVEESVRDNNPKVDSPEVRK